jgi:hypothetical protein
MMRHKKGSQASSISCEIPSFPPSILLHSWLSLGKRPEHFRRTKWLSL